MTVIDDHLVTCDPEPAAAEALFKEAKRCERRRRLSIAGIALLVAIGATIAATIGGGGSPRPSREDSSGPRPLGPGTSALFTVVTGLSLGGAGPSTVATDPESLFITGTFVKGKGAPATLVRVDPPASRFGSASHDPKRDERRLRRRCSLVGDWRSPWPDRLQVQPNA